MTAEIFPLSPKIPDVHVMLSGPAGAPGRVTRPVTGPEAQPASAVVVSATSTTAYPTYSRAIARLPEETGTSIAGRHDCSCRVRLASRRRRAPWDLGPI